MIITIDGPSGAGKSTAARLLAKRLGLDYLDTGATYRALAYQAIKSKVDPHDEAEVSRLIPRLSLRLLQYGNRGLRVVLSGKDITYKIRCEQVTEAASVIAQQTRIRNLLVRLQRSLMNKKRGIVAEGRDTGSMVFPKADHKFFLIANAAIRARRRYKELRLLCHDTPSFGLLIRQIKRRDHLDRTRKTGPLIRPKGSILLNTSNLDENQVLDRLLKHVLTGPNGHGLRNHCA